MAKTLLHNWRKTAFLKDSNICWPWLFFLNPFPHDSKSAIAALTQARTSLVALASKAGNESWSCWMASYYWSEQSSRSCSMTGFKVLLLSNVVLMYEDVFVAFEDARFNAITTWKSINTNGNIKRIFSSVNFWRILPTEIFSRYIPRKLPWEKN